MEFDVVVAGAGPNGLMAACELALAGARTVVVEERTAPTTGQRANGMVGQVIELLDRRGLLERLTGTKDPPAPTAQFMFAAFPLRHPIHTVMVPQQRVEAMLAGRAAELGVQIRHGHPVTGFRQDADRVTVSVGDGSTVDAAFLVGADGGHSRVRKLAGIDFPGVTRDHTVSRTAHVSVPLAWKDPASGGLRIPGYGVIPPFLHHRTERGLVAYAPFPDGRTLLSVSTAERPEGPEPLTLTELSDVLAYVLGVPVPLGPPDGDGPHLMRRLTGGSTRLASRYRDGRVLLAGDAAHVHSAIGGSGLNLGLQDAVNLAWKLAATVHGWAPPGLLDTYESERRPVAERVVMHTQAQSVLIGPGPEVTALRTLFGELLEDPATRRHIAGLISGSDFRYETVPPSTSPPAGAFAPDVGPVSRSARPLLVDNTGTLAAVAAPWRDRVDLITAQVPDATALLIRPDCYVAWASTGPSPDRAGLVAALTHWFGAPTVRPPSRVS